MSIECEALHKWARNIKRHIFPFDESALPSNGIYVLFEKGEEGHQGERIVRIGTHTGADQLISRLKQHFLNQCKDRSIFRKNIGRAILNRNGDPFLAGWERDLTTRKAREKHASTIDLIYQHSVEEQVSQYIRSSFSFCVFAVPGKEARLDIESKMISTVSLCDDCRPSKTWLGTSSPKEKIAKSGLWQVNELYKTPFDALGIDSLSTLVTGEDDILSLIWYTTLVQ